MDVSGIMDGMLAALPMGRKPVTWTIHERDWIDIVRQYHEDGMMIDEPHRARTYRGIPVSFGPINEDQVVLLEDGPSDDE